MTDSVVPFSRDAVRAEAGQHFSVDGRPYILMGGISDGAIGVVRKARDQVTQRVVAVKFLAPEFRYIEQSSFADIRERFRREGQKGTWLDQDNLVEIISYEENADGAAFPNEGFPINPFIVMEYIPGKTLESFIKAQIKEKGQGSINVNRTTLKIAASVNDALIYLHRRSCVHRDVKPGNIFLSSEARRGDDGQVKLGDFGVVKWNDFLASINTGQLTTSGQIGLGTLKYMSPEQVTKPKDVLIASDMYSMGATLFELFTNLFFSNNLEFFLITMARTQRGNTLSRLYDTNVGLIPLEFEPLFELILDMLALGPTSRPTSTRTKWGLSRAMEMV